MDVSIFGLLPLWWPSRYFCYLVGSVVKATPFDNNNYIPIACGFAGLLLALRHYIWACRVSGHRPHHGRGCGCGVRPCRHGY